MAHFVKTPPLEKILKFMSPNVTSGSTGEQVYRLPIYLRRDGVVIKLGYLMKKSGVEILYIVREILASEHMKNITVILSPIEYGEAGVAKMKEELHVVDVEEVNPLKGRMMSLELARDGMRKVATSIARYPLHIQRLLRKHQLATQIRNSVQKFLAGFSLARSTNIGCVDWRLDPGLLGLERETDFSLEYRVERFAGGIMSHLDLLLGKGWDVRKVGGGFRVIMTLELSVDVNQQIRLDTHATLCQGELDTNYRTKCMDVFSSSVVSPPTPHFLLFSRDTTKEHLERKSETPDKFESLQSNKGAGVSLDWEEFQDSQDEVTLDVSSEDINHTIEASAFSENGSNVIKTPHDSPDSSCNDLEALTEPSEAIKKLLDTPTKAFSQIVFNVSNKHSGDSSENRAEVAESVPDSLVDEIVSKIRKVKLSEDSFETSYEREKEEDQNEEAKLGPINSCPENHEHTHIGDVTPKVESSICRPSTSTPDIGIEDDVDHDEESLDVVFNDTISQDDLNLCMKDVEISQDPIHQLVNKEADESLDNIPDLIHDELADSSEIRHLSLQQSTPDIPATKDGMLAVISPDEDICSEDYRVSSSNEMQKELYHEYDVDTVISFVKDHPVKQPFDNQNLVSQIITPDNMIASPQSSVNKVAAYVQSLPSPQINDGINEVVDDMHEVSADTSKNTEDESVIEDGANNSLTSSRSRASRQSDLSNLTGRFSNGVGGIFFGSALGQSGASNGQAVCPFPEDWQFNTIPESIENDDDID